MNVHQLTQLSPSNAKSKIDLMSIAEISKALGIGIRTLWRWVSSGQFPKPDLSIGRVRRWKVETIQAWIDR